MNPARPRVSLSRTAGFGLLLCMAPAVPQTPTHLQGRVQDASARPIQGATVVADGPRVIGFDPFVKLVDWLEAEAAIVNARSQEPELAGAR